MAHIDIEHSTHKLLQLT